MNPSYTIILPLYRPKGKWILQLLDNITALDRCLPGDMEVKYIIVNDGATDECILSGLRLVSEEFPRISFISYEENRGKGYALRTGVNAAQTPFVLILDLDFPYKNENIVELIYLLKEENCDIVVGKRSTDYFQHLSLKRKIISKCCSLLNRIFFELPLYDTQSGIKGFNKRGRSVFLQTRINRFLIDTEFLLRAKKQDLTIKIINIELRPGILLSKFGVKVLKAELHNFISLIYLNKKLKRIYKIRRKNDWQKNCSS